ncbi:hypothetical protein ST37_01820 (plasmid) [Vibrio sp. qd031]|nr:hypothetical protein ST37_01820 [Vibrio sp. qd031]
MTSIRKAVISAVIFVISLILMILKVFDSGGILLLFLMTGAFFTTCIQVIMHFTGYKKGDVYEVFHDAANIEAESLTNLVTKKDDKHNTR